MPPCGEMCVGAADVPLAAEAAGAEGSRRAKRPRAARGMIPAICPSTLPRSRSRVPLPPLRLLLGLAERPVQNSAYLQGRWHRKRLLGGEGKRGDEQSYRVEQSCFRLKLRQAGVRRRGRDLNKHNIPDALDPSRCPVSPRIETNGTGSAMLGLMPIGACRTATEERTGTASKCNTVAREEAEDLSCLT